MGKRMRNIFLVIGLMAGIILGDRAFLGDKNCNGPLKKGIATIAEAAEAPATTFAWYPNRPGIKRAQIALGRAATLKFEFFVKGNPNVVNVKFGLPKKYADMGIKVDPSQVAVSEGKAASKAVFSVPPGMPLGRFDVPVVAVDAKTGEEIGRGEIQIMLLPAGVGGC